ncbi:MAG: molybdopterin-dependent oxidoreductase [Actinobacteria bacterium]|nr:molybdopterin-dependent oxidoreductase [Actinomycetota bacterium]
MALPPQESSSNSFHSHRRYTLYPEQMEETRGGALKEFGGIGATIPRHEDPALVRGRERFAGDLAEPGQLSMAVLRSYSAHGTLGSIDADAARALPGVAAVLTAADLITQLGSVPLIPPRLSGDDASEPWLQPVLAHEKVRYVGEPIAIVVARDRYTAEDALEQIFVDIAPLSPLIDPVAALDADPLFSSGNLVRTMDSSYGDTHGAFASADVVVEKKLTINAHTAMPMETRGLVAIPGIDGSLTICGATKVPHWNRSTLARLLGVPEDRIRMLETAVGGGFGVRGEFYPEDFLVAWAANTVGQPVSWIEDRREHFLATNHARNQIHFASLAGNKDGLILGLRSEFWANLGAYVRTNGLRVPEVTVSILPGPYNIPNYQGIARCVVTNRTPAGTYRAPGRVESCFVRETLIEMFAERIGADPLEVRKLNLVGPSEMPYQRILQGTGKPALLEEADYPGILTRAHAAFDSQAATSRAPGRSATGIGAFLERSTLGPFEWGEIGMTPDGKVSVRSGGSSVGQGIRTVLAQIVAGCLEVPSSDVTVELLDTDLVPQGIGSFGSRSTIAAGSAVHLASLRFINEAKRIASELLEASPEDLVSRNGGIEITGVSDQRVEFSTIAGIYLEEDPSRSTMRFDATFETSSVTYDFGAHFADVVVDDETGEVTLQKLLLAFDVGRAVNPMLVEGQMLGGAVQGIGGALLEQLRFDVEGNPLTTSFMDYLIPTLHEVPDMQALLIEDRSSGSNPLGVRGVGEGGITGVPAAIANAVNRAIGRAGAIDSLPITPEDVLRALSEGSTAENLS